MIFRAAEQLPFYWKADISVRQGAAGRNRQKVGLPGVNETIGWE